MKSLWHAITQPKTLRWWAMFAGFLLLISRRPDVLLNAQFWAEDGAYWFREAYAYGWASLFKPHTGYLQTISRLSALVVQTMPLVWAPLLFNLVAIGIRVTVVGWLFSSRFLPSLNIWWRVLAALIYIGLPNSAEVFANLTNAHWHLALLAFMMAWSRPPRGWQKWTDAVVFLLMGLSGPFVLIIAPLACWYWHRNQEFKTRLTSVIMLLVAFIVQVGMVISTGSDQRTHMELGASLALLEKIVVGQIMAAGILGEKAYAMLWRHGLFTHPVGYVVWVSALVISVGVCINALRRGSSIVRYGLMAAGALLTASLFSPMASTTQPQWGVMLPPGAAGRYWFIPTLAFLGMIIWWLTTGSEKWRRSLGIGFAVVLFVGIIWNWRLTPWPRTDFAEQARVFSTAASGTTHTFKLTPANWAMTLVKKE